MASGSGTDVWSGEENLLAAQARAGHPCDAPWDRGRSQNRLAEIRSLWTTEHGFYRASESDRTPWGSSLGTSHVGHGAAWPTTAGPSGVVASVLSFCASSRITPGGARAATRTRGQSSGTTLPAANPSDGSGENTSTMDGSRGAHLPIAAGFRLRANKPRCRGSVMSWSGWAKCQRKKSDGASLQDEMVCLDCPMTKKPA
jgi:hypothetical protein